MKRLQLLVTVTARCKFLTAFDGANGGIVGSNSSWGMDVYPCVCLRLVRILALRHADTPTKHLKTLIISMS
jgi:hypothetical protein